MALSLSTPEGDEVEVTPVEMPSDVQAAADAFHRAQANDPLTDDTRRPPKRPVADKSDPGYTPNPAPRRGRPKKGDPEASRTTDKAPVDKKKPLEPHDFTADLQATADLLWLGASTLPVAAPYAAIFKANSPAIVQAVNAGAQVNHDVRNFCEKMTSGTGNAWVLSLGMVGVTMGMQCWAAMQNPEMRAQLAQSNAHMANEYMNALAGQVA